MKLDTQEINRYSRHLLLKEVGMQGQEKLKAAKVLVIGAGGLGCPILLYLSAAGVGTIGIIDFDVIDESNLQRQILYDIVDIGKSKSLVAKQKLEAKNQFIEITAYDEHLTTRNALDLFGQYDIIVDGTDNFATRYMVNDACVIASKPLVYGSIHRFEGQISVFNYQNGPTYRCLFPTPPKAGSVPNCSEVGVIGVLPGIIGAQQANEVLKIILGIGDVLTGRMMVYDSLAAKYMEFKIKPSENILAKSAEEFKNFDYDFFCGSGIKDKIPSISKQEFDAIAHTEFVLDVRDSWEHPQLTFENVLNAPLDDLEDFIEQIPRDKKVYVVCQKGGRSAAAIEILKEEYQFENLYNVEGGLIG